MAYGLGYGRGFYPGTRTANPEKFQLFTINSRNVDTDSDNQDISVDGHAIERMGK